MRAKILVAKTEGVNQSMVVQKAERVTRDQKVLDLIPAWIQYMSRMGRTGPLACLVLSSV